MKESRPPLLLAAALPDNQHLEGNTLILINSNTFCRYISYIIANLQNCLFNLFSIINSLSSMYAAWQSHGGVTGGGSGATVYTTGGCGDF